MWRRAPIVPAARTRYLADISDTVRGWAAYMIAALPGLGLGDADPDLVVAALMLAALVGDGVRRAHVPVDPLQAQLAVHHGHDGAVVETRGHSL